MGGMNSWESVCKACGAEVRADSRHDVPDWEPGWCPRCMKEAMDRLDLGVFRDAGWLLRKDSEAVKAPDGAVYTLRQLAVKDARGLIRQRAGGKVPEVAVRLPGPQTAVAWLLAEVDGLRVRA